MTEEADYQKMPQVMATLGIIARWCFKSILVLDMLYLVYRICNLENITIFLNVLFEISKMILKRLRYVVNRCADFFYCLGTSLFVLQNKMLLGGKPMNLFAPLFITWYRFFIMTVIMFVWSTHPRLLPSRERPYRNPLCWPTMKKVLPLTLLYILKTLSENVCLLYSDVSFYLLGTSLVSFFNVILLYKFYGTRPSKYTCWASFFIASGFIIGVGHEYLAGTFSAVGTLFSVLSSFFYALYAFRVKKVLHHINNELWVIMYFNNLYSTVLILPFLAFEKDEIVSKLMPQNFGITQVLTFTCLALSGVVTMIYKAIHIERDATTSVSKLELRGITRAHFQVGIVADWYNESKPLYWWVASTMASFGSEWNLIEKLYKRDRRRKFFYIVFTIWFCLTIHTSYVYQTGMPEMLKMMK